MRNQAFLSRQELGALPSYPGAKPFALWGDLTKAFREENLSSPAPSASHAQLSFLPPYHHSRSSSPECLFSVSHFLIRKQLGVCSLDCGHTDADREATQEPLFPPPGLLAG